MRYASILSMALLFAASLFSSCSNKAWYSESQPGCTLMMLRFRGATTYSDEAWDNTFRIIKENPGCCDEVWFSTGLGFPSMEAHSERASIINRGTQELKSIGVSSSLQVQMTIGHGDYLAKGEEHLYSGLTWRRWTGSTGVVDRYCSCPRDHEFLNYMREMAHIYAETHPRAVWIDDDLRYDNHLPATDGSHIGCWCDGCISDFNAVSGGCWTATTLATALEKNDALATEWENFCISSLNDIARTIGEEFKKVSPETRLGYQNCMREKDVAILQTLHEVSGQPVCLRPGGGDYYDNVNADGLIVKSMRCATYRRRIGNPDWIPEWCPEIEAWPRVYGSRTPQGVLVEGFTALAYGMNAVSMFVIATEKESPEVYSQTMLRPLAAGSPMLRAYAKANEGTEPVGYSADASNRLYRFACSGIPVLPGCGKDLGPLTDGDLGRPNFVGEVSDTIQDLREEMDARSASPVVCCSPYIGLIIPRINGDGTLRTIALQNVRIDAQGPVKLHLKNLPEGVRSVKWFEMKKKPVKLAVTSEDGEKYVTIPEIGAWNCGFIDIPYDPSYFQEQ